MLSDTVFEHYRFCTYVEFSRLHTCVACTWCTWVEHSSQELLEGTGFELLTCEALAA